MKGMRGKLLKKLKSVRVLQLNASDGFVADSWSKRSVLREHNRMSWENQEQSNISCVNVPEPVVIDVPELMKDIGDEELGVGVDDGDKENMGPPPPVKGRERYVDSERFSEVGEETEDELSGVEEADSTSSSDIEISSFRRPKLNSRSLFDPKLLAAFRRAVKEHIKIIEAERRARSEEQGQEPPLKARRIDEEQSQSQSENQIEDLDPLLGFEEKCPPGGDGGVIFYTTTLRGIRKTFENCNSVRFLLETFRVGFIERDISMHTDFKEELRRVLHGEAAVPPKLFVKGRYIGGAEEVLRLHEQGKLRPLFEGVPVDRSTGPCEGCAGVRFVVCFECSGSRKIFSDDGLWDVCVECNENGLLVCPVCC